MRRLLVGLLVLLVIAAGVDRLGAYVAGRVIASRLGTDAGLSHDPRVRITGFPFLTQVLAGRYDRIDVQAKDVQRRGVHLSRLRADLVGVQLPLAKAASGSVKELPVLALTGRVTLSYADVVRGRTELVARPLDHGRIRVTGRLTVLGLTVEASTKSTVALKGTDVVITAQSLSVEGLSNPLVDRAIAGRLDLRVPVGSLPYGLRLSGVRVTPGGLVLDARSGPTILRAP